MVRDWVRDSVGWGENVQKYIRWVLFWKGFFEHVRNRWRYGVVGSGLRSRRDGDRRERGLGSGFGLAAGKSGREEMSEPRMTRITRKREGRKN